MYTHDIFVCPHIFRYNNLVLAIVYKHLQYVCGSALQYGFFKMLFFFSCNQNIGEILTQCKKVFSNVLITGESNFDEKNGQEMIN